MAATSMERTSAKQPVGYTAPATAPTAVTIKKIALFSDGTGNSSAKAQKTNVWRLFQALDQSNSAQIAKYDDGVGTSSNKYLAALGGAFGYGLKRNVLDLYKFVCRNYRAAADGIPGDDIYCFGFSRGAFTIRVLVGLIAREGLVTFRSQAELDRNAAAAYRSFRNSAFPTKSPIVRVSRMLRDLVLHLHARVTGHDRYKKIHDATEKAGRTDIPIRFLGLWDTVEAYGMPIVELKRAINWALWPMLFGDMKLTRTVERAVHALSLDDERTTFHPLLWDECWEAELARNAAKTQPTAARTPRMTQVWFAGVHSNVGGGYPEDQLSLVPLEWIMTEAIKSGLAVNAGEVARIAEDKSPFARLYDSRSGMAAYYRYSPRRTPHFECGGKLILPIVHWSVLLRMVHGTDSYAPITLPHTFEVLTPKNEQIEIGELLSRVHGGKETSGDTRLDEAIQCLCAPDHDQVGLVWDTVFWRTCLYSLTMLLTVLAVGFPLFTKSLPDSMKNDVDSAMSGPVSVFVDAFSALIPSYAAMWKGALIAFPLEFGLLLIGIALTLSGSQILEGRIHDRAVRVWRRPTDKNVEKAKHYQAWRDEGRRSFGRSIFTTVLLLTGIAIACVAGITATGADNGALKGSAVSFGIAAAALLVAYAVSAFGNRQRVGGGPLSVRKTSALKLARRIRENSLLTTLYGINSKYVLPSVFVVLIVWAGFMLVNRAAFDVMSSAGLWCKGNEVSVEGEWQEKLHSAVASPFRTDQTCWATGLVVRKDHRYIVTITTRPEAGKRWFDRDVPTDPTGFPTDSWRHRLAAPQKRWWSADWFQPIARIGRYGNDEYPLEALNDVTPLRAARKLPRMAGWSIPPKIDSILAGRINELSPVPTDRLVIRSEFKARHDGELFLFVNDAVLGIPGLKDLFLRNNSGSACVTIERWEAFRTGTVDRAVPLKEVDGAPGQPSKCLPESGTN